MTATTDQERIVKVIEYVVANDLDFITAASISMHAHCSERDAAGAIAVYESRTGDRRRHLPCPSGPGALCGARNRHGATIVLLPELVTCDECLTLRGAEASQ